MTPNIPQSKPVRRLGLFLPVILFGLVVLAWSGFWFYARQQAQMRFGAALEREARNGRQWSCENAAFGGYPFRLELRCSDVLLVRTSSGGAPWRVQLGGLAALAQVYSPGHVIIESPGPLRVTAPDGANHAVTWTQAQMSGRLSLSGFERASLVVAQPVLQAAGAAPAAPIGQAKALELHVRRHPTRPAADQAVEIFATATDMVAPAFEALIRNGAPSQFELAATVPRSDFFLGGIRPESLKAWSAAGGQLTLDKVQIRKGPSELALAGMLGLDDLNRLRGRITASQIGILEIGGVRVGGMLGLGGLLVPPAAGTLPAGHKPLPPVDLRDGRVYLGPIRVPEMRLDPMF
jgi:hypothetical protein